LDLSDADAVAGGEPSLVLAKIAFVDCILVVKPVNEK
jgi:hypothetical protein